MLTVRRDGYPYEQMTTMTLNIGGEILIGWTECRRRKMMTAGDDGIGYVMDF